MRQASASTQTLLDDLAGRYELCPGQTVSVRGRRGVLTPGRLTRLLHGMDTLQAQRTLGSVFTLCGHAHQRALQLAIQCAATQCQLDETTVGIMQLSMETARDQLRTMALDWPRLGLGHPPNLDWLTGCPIPLGPARFPTEPVPHAVLAQHARAWLQNLLDAPPQDWLNSTADERQMLQWCMRAASRVAPASALANWAQNPTLQHKTCAAKLVDPHAGDTIAAVNASLIDQPEFSQFPNLHQRCAETGPWSRSRLGLFASPLVISPWQRLASRWRDFVACLLSVIDHTVYLRAGARPVGQNAAIAWVEMARGVLLYRVSVDTEQRVTDIRIVAPTEWNFHPRGCLAQHVGALRQDQSHDARLLAMAWDACVECVVNDNRGHQETTA